MTVRANIERLVGGAQEDTIIARVGQGIVSAIGSSGSYKDVLENPDQISRKVLDSGLDDQFWITGADDYLLKLWKPMDEECVAVLAGHSAPVRSACFFDNGSMIAGGSSDGSVRLWGLEWALAGKPGEDRLENTGQILKKRQGLLKEQRFLQEQIQH